MQGSNNCKLPADCRKKDKRGRAVEIREIRLEDIAQIAELEREIFPDAWSENAIRETWDQEQSILLGAFQGEILKGYLIVYCVLDELEIARIAVRPSGRRQGIAGALLKNLEKKSEELKIVRWLLDVRESNQAAISLYKKYEFSEDGKRKNFYTDPTESAILMSRNTGK